VREEVKKGALRAFRVKRGSSVRGGPGRLGGGSKGI